MAGDPSAFDLAGDERGVLLIHGFTSTPFEVRTLGERLHAQGMTAIGLVLPGHGTTPAELDRTRFGAWVAEVERAARALALRCRRVALVGQSLGGLLALHLAASHQLELAAVATLGAPMWLGRSARALIAALRIAPALAALGPLPKAGGSDVADRIMWAANPSYPVTPLRALRQFDDVRRIVRRELERVRVPVLVIHAIHDHVAPFGSADEIARRVSSADVERLTLARSYHLVAMDLERERVADAVGGFLAQRMG